MSLPSTLRKPGREEEAEHYLKRVVRYRDSNPYFHYFQAQAAYRQNEFEDALACLAKAIRLKRDEHQFYSLRGLVHYRTGEYGLAAKDYRKARDTAEMAQLISGYTRKIKALESRLY